MSTEAKTPVEPPLPLSYADAPRPDSRFDAITFLSRLGPLIGLILVFVLFSILRPNTFPTAGNIEIMLRFTAIVGIAALGMTIVIIAGGIDLSVGANIALSTVVIAQILAHGWSPLVAIAGGIFVSSLYGLLIGFSVTALRISPFIVTLGLWLAVRGRAESFADNANVYIPLENQSRWLNSLFMPPQLHAAWLYPVLLLWLGLVILHFVLAEVRMRRYMTLRTIGLGIFPFLLIGGVRIVTGKWAILSPCVWLMLFLALIVSIILRNTRFGRHVFAIGSNESAARLCGVPVWRTKLAIYMLGAGFAGLAGVVEFSKLRVGDPTTQMGGELDVIAAVVIGGASLSGGKGSIVGTLTGALLMTVIRIGLTKMDIHPGPQKEVTGFIIIAAAAIDQLRQRRS